jgi:hypothetical protein
MLSKSFPVFGMERSPVNEWKDVIDLGLWVVWDLKVDESEDLVWWETFWHGHLNFLASFVGIIDVSYLADEERSVLQNIAWVFGFDDIVVEEGGEEWLRCIFCFATETFKHLEDLLMVPWLVWECDVCVPLISSLIIIIIIIHWSVKSLGSYGRWTTRLRRKASSAGSG